MRTQIQLTKAAIDRLDLIIEKMKAASGTWRKDLVDISNEQLSEATDEALVLLTQRVKCGAETMKVYVNEYVKDTEDLSVVVINSHSLFKEFGVVTKAKEEG
jgi:hypothetical protein